MAAETTVATATIKGGAMLASGGLLAEAVIFSDNSYTYLAIAGAIISTFWLSTRYGATVQTNTLSSAPSRNSSKGLSLGCWRSRFFILRSSFALIASFALSWYTVPFFNWISDNVRRVAK